MSCKLFIGGLSRNTDDDSLRGRFEEFGSITDAIVIKDRESGRSRGFGFVTFANESDADAAIQNMNNTEFDGRTIRVDKAGERPEGGSGGFRGPRSGGAGFGDRRPRGSFGGPRRPYEDRSTNGYGGERRGYSGSGGYRSAGYDRPRREEL